MEHGGSLFHYEQHEISSSGSIIPLQQTNTSADKETPTPINSSNDVPVPNLAVRDKINMPITNVTKNMRQILPKNAKISDSAKEMTQQCVTKFITFVTRKAKERCQSEYRKTLSPEDLLWAIEKLGFHDYVGPLTVFLQRHRHSEGDLFKNCVRQSIDNNGPISGPNPAPRPITETPQPALPPPLNSFGPDFSMDPNSTFEMFDPNDFTEFYMDGFFGLGSPDGALTNLDPFSPFKHDRV